MKHSIRKKLKNGERLFGSWASIGHSSMADILCSTGIDFLGVDMEHSTISLQEAQMLITAAQGLGKSCMPRVSSHNGEQIKRLMDAGADGVIVPNVATPEELSKIIEWVKYPPIGKRGFGIYRAQKYGPGFGDYVQRWNEESALIIMVESIEGINNMEELVNNEYVDGVMIGPYDLSGSMGFPGQIDHPKVKEAYKTGIKVCQKFKKAMGIHLIHPNEANVKEAIQDGFQFLVLSSDVLGLWKVSEELKNLIETNKKA